MKSLEIELLLNVLPNNLGQVTDLLITVTSISAEGNDLKTDWIDMLVISQMQSQTPQGCFSSDVLIPMLVQKTTEKVSERNCIQYK